MDCSVTDILTAVEVPAAIIGFLFLVYTYLHFEAKKEAIRSQERLQMATRPTYDQQK
jgi:hypothetical protein